MEDIFTYELRDFLMFSPVTYYQMIEAYNTDVSYAIFLPSIFFVIALAWRDWRNQNWPLLALIGGMFCWVAWQFFFVRFQEIMWASAYLGSAFFVQGIALLWFAQIEAVNGVKSKENNGRRRLNYGPALLLLFPAFGYLGMGEPEFFGLTPDPTVYLALAVLYVMRKPIWLYIIPLCWVCFSWLLLLAMEQAHAWLLPALTAAMLIFLHVLGRKSTLA